MPAFSYCVTTKLSRGRVWSLLTDITNWPKFSDMYSDLHWDGTPWAEGSAKFPVQAAEPDNSRAKR